METYVYRVKYSRAECIAGALMQLYSPFSGGGYGGGYGGGGPYGGGGYGGGYGGGGYGGGGYGGGGYGGGGYGGGGGGGTIGGANAGLGVGGGCGGSMGGGMGGGYGGGGYGGGYGGGGYGAGGYGAGAYGGGYAPQIPQGTGGAAQTGAPGTTADLTGSYLGNNRAPADTAAGFPRIVPNPLDNSLLIQATPSQYQGILKLLAQIDIPPRQILLEAKIYEVSLTGAFASGVSAYLQKLGQTTQQSSGGSTSTISSPHDFLASLAGGSTFLSAGAMVGHSRELLGFLGLQENSTRARVLSAPSLIATDSIAASITVGNEVPTLQAQAAGNVQVGGNSTFTQSIQSRQTGVTLNVMARVNPSGIVTLIINQDVSAPQPPASDSSIQSPSFSNRSVQTQITMQDGDTIAIGGIINESNSSSSSGIPFLNRIPYLGTAFGSHSVSKDRTELIVFMTPHVIYDNTDLLEASDELKGRLKKLRKYVRE
jgi:general secretion pathway protein D